MGSKIYLSLILIILTQSSGDSFEDQHQFGYSHAYAPHSLDFHDIYPPGHSALPEEPLSTASDEDSHLNSISTQFVEFHPQVLNIQAIPTLQGTVLNSSSVNETVVTHSRFLSSRLSTLTASTTSEPDEIPIKVVPVKHYERGVLDLLLPPPRVRAFKNVFDTIRRMLSYTFKKR